jgi:acid phosphatase type 7
LRCAISATAALLAAIAAVAAATGTPTNRVRAPTLLAAGDIGFCGSQAAATAALVASRRGTVATLGDNAYPSGSADDFARCYNPTWGRFKSRTRPSIGNHEYRTPTAAGYFGYFGHRAGRAGQGYYSYRLGTWSILVLNSNCDQIGGCGEGSAEESWLRATLRAHRNLCTLAYWHHPRFSEGPHRDDSELDSFWRDLYAAGAEVVLNGHDHTYQRFAPQSPAGEVDPAYGIREFVVGTGGAPLYRFLTDSPNSEARNDTTYGILRLVLGRRGYSWQYVAVGAAFKDGGNTPCHRRPPESG